METISRILTVFIIGISFFLKKVDAENISLTSNAYERVVVGISSNIDKSLQTALILQLQSMFDEANPILFRATNYRAYFTNITVLQPSSFYQLTQSNYEGSSLRSDQLVGNTNFQNAHIRIDLQNRAYGNMPYVQQSRGCGIQGDFIHLTPNFVQNIDILERNMFGSREQLFVQQWIKFRYGVFDEFGYSDDKRHPQRYYDAQGNLQYNLCSNDHTINWDADTQCSLADGVVTQCTLKIAANNTSIESSILSTPVLPAAITICDDTTHNKDAPNKQNTFCNLKSAWEIMSQHDDFANDANPPASSTLKIKAVTITPSYGSSNGTLGIYVLWDSLTSDQASSAKPALTKFCFADLPNNSYIGQMNSYNTTINHGLQKVYSNTNRNVACGYFKSLQSSTSSSASSDLQTPISTLSNDLSSRTNLRYASILIFSNTGQSTATWSSLCNSSQNLNVVLHLFSYNDQTTQNFINAQCLGQAFLIKSPKAQTTLLKQDYNNQNKCMSSLQERAQLDISLMSVPTIMDPDSYPQPIMYLQQMYNISMNSSFHIEDNSDYINSYFYVYSCSDMSPSHYMNPWLSTQGNVLTYQDQLQGFSFDNYGLLNSSTYWRYGNTLFDQNSYIPYMVSAYGRQIPGVYGSFYPKIEVSSWTSTENVGNYPIMIIFASVKFGTTPIISAKVTASLISGTTQNYFNVTLYDDGSGNPDISAADGVYSSYFTQHDIAAQTYTISIKIADNNGQAYYATQAAYWITGNPPYGATPTGTFSRVTSPGSVVVPFQTGDQIPPGTINDLYVVSYGSNTVTLAWTAPGNDLDYGTAISYSMECGADRDAMLAQLNESPTSTTWMPQPEVAKILQSVTIVDESRTTKYCAIRARDSYQYGASSNVVSYYVEDKDDGKLSIIQIAIIVAGSTLVVMILIILVALVLCLLGCCKPKAKKRPANNSVQYG